MDKLTYSTEGTAQFLGLILLEVVIVMVLLQVRETQFHLQPTQYKDSQLDSNLDLTLDTVSMEPLTGGQRSIIDKLDLATDTSSTTTPFVRSGTQWYGNLSKVDKGYLVVDHHRLFRPFLN